MHTNLYVFTAMNWTGQEIILISHSCVRCRVVTVCLGGRGPEGLKDAQVCQVQLALLTLQGG